MATITTILATDLITNSRADINNNFANLNTDKIETSTLDTDTTLAANSDAKIATQKAVKAYVDAGGNVNASTTAKGIVEEATQAEVDAGTGAGATGARLFVSPSTLGLSQSLLAGETINGATLPVPVYQNKTDNEFYACDANDATKYKFLGFAISNGTDGGALSVKFTGVVSGFSGLDEGEKYYVSDTVGTIANAPGSQEIMVGVAISPTQLLIQKGKRYAKGTIAFSSTTTSAITLGFRPSNIIVQASAAGTDNDFQGVSGGGWNVHSGNSCQYSSYYGDATGAGAGLDTSNAWHVMEPNNATGQVGVITSVTDTGFTLSNTETSTGTPVQICWIAEGEL